MARIHESTFAIASNGHVDGPPQALRDHLVRNGARRVTTVFHPLGAEDARHAGDRLAPVHDDALARVGFES